MSKFKTKEEYLNFISAWKKAANAEEAKSKRVVCDHSQYTFYYPGYTNEEQARFEDNGYVKISEFGYTIPDGGHRKEPGWLNAEHYIFHNMMRDKNPMRGFNPRSPRKIVGYDTPWFSYLQGLWKLESAIADAEYYLEVIGKGSKPANGHTAREFLVPFDGEITMSDLLKIDKEELANARAFLINLTYSNR